MTNIPRAAIHATPQTAFSPNQANENTRDGWNEMKYMMKNTMENGHHYDFTRKGLNFAVTKEGIKPLTITTAQELYDKYLNRLAELRFKAYNPKSPNQPKSYIDWVFSGDHDVMTKLAFGDQEVSYDLSDDNSHIVRQHGIERFAQAVFDFVCRKWGEENVIGVEVHLDETTPHIHVNMIPVELREQRGRASYNYKNAKGEIITSAQYRNLSKEKRKEFVKTTEIERKVRECVSYSGMVGRNRIERSQYLRNFHTAFHEEVGQYFGLARGHFHETLTEDESRNRRHKTASELETEAHQRAEKAIEEAKELEEALIEKRKEHSALQNQLENAENELSNVKQKTADLRDQLSDVFLKKEKVEEEYKSWVRKMENLAPELTKKVSHDMESSAWLMAIADSVNLMKNLAPTLTDEQIRIIDNSMLDDMAYRANEVVAVATVLFLGYIDQATEFAQMRGGGSGPGSGWSRDKNEDDEHFRRRCLQTARRMMKKPIVEKKRTGWHR